MIVPDTNLLIYAYDRGSPHHAKAKIWWERTLSGKESVGLPEVVLLAFIRLTTHPSLQENPLDVRLATRLVQSWIDCPVARILHGQSTTLPRIWSLLHQLDRAGNLTTDAWIAALTIEADATLHTNDHEFTLFSGLRCENPLVLK